MSYANGTTPTGKASQAIAKVTLQYQKGLLIDTEYISKVRQLLEEAESQEEVLEP